MATTNSTGVTDVKHIVMTMKVNPNAEGDAPSEVEEVLRGYFAKGWTLHTVHNIHASRDTVSNQYVLVK